MCRHLREVSVSEPRGTKNKEIPLGNFLFKKCIRISLNPMGFLCAAMIAALLGKLSLVLKTFPYLKRIKSLIDHVLHAEKERLRQLVPCKPFPSLALVRLHEC